MSRWKKVWSGLLACAMLLTCQVTALAEETKTVALDVVLVVDDTVSMQTNDPNHIATVALQQFAGSIPSVGSRVGMATYSADILTQQPVIEVDSPEDAEQLRQYAQNGLTQNGRYTDLPSALKYAVDQLNQLEERDNPQVVIAVSDGENDFATDADRQASDEALLSVLAADIPVYIIGVNSSGSISQYLQGIADNTGGSAYFAESGDQIESILQDITNQLYGYVDEGGDEVHVGDEEQAWPFKLEEGVFECNLDLDHTSKLEMRLQGPDGQDIPMNAENGIAVFETSGNGSLHTSIKMLEPTGGEYVLYIRSADGSNQTVKIKTTLNNEIYVQVTPSSTQLSGGDSFSVEATLMRGSEKYTDLAFSRLQAVADFNGQQVPLTANNAGFQGNFTAPDADGDYTITVTVTGKTFMRTSDPVTVTVGKGGGAASSGSAPTTPQKGGLPWWIFVIIAAVVAAVAVLLLKLRGGKSRTGESIRLQGTLVVTYYRQAGVYTWEKYVLPGSYYSKRSPMANLGKMLRDLHDPEDIPQEFDQLFVGGVMDPDRQQYVVIRGELASGEEKQSVYTRLKIDTGMGADDDFDSFSFEDSNKISLILPSGGTVEFSFMLG